MPPTRFDRWFGHGLMFFVALFIGAVLFLRCGSLLESLFTSVLTAIACGYTVVALLNDSDVRMQVVLRGKDDDQAE